jgi:hypothetical protein
VFSLCLSGFVMPAEVGADNNLYAPALSEVSAEQSVTEQGGSDGASRYRTREGIQIVSYVDAWPVDKLPEIAEELYKNRHGLEMEYLDRIEIYPDMEPNGNEQVSASYEKDQQQLSIPVNLSGFLPADYKLEVSVEKGVIRIYKGEEKTEIEDIAMELSHEYGHHFTFFHFGDTFSARNFKESTYYNLRQLHQYPEVNGEASYEEQTHRWSVFELAAEDYLQLLGSPTGKRITRYLDINQKMGSTTYQPVNTASRFNFNAIPQENWNIPLASQVEGLYQYFLSFLEEPPSTAVTAMIPSQNTGEILPQLSHRVEEQYNFRKHIIEWDGIDTENSEQPVYTLVAIDRDNRVIPIKTVYPGEKTSAVVGTVTQAIDSFIYYYQDGLDQGSLDFRLYLQYPNGRVLAAEDLTVEFNEK